MSIKCSLSLVNYGASCEDRNASINRNLHFYWTHEQSYCALFCNPVTCFGKCKTIQKLNTKSISIILSIDWIGNKLHSNENIGHKINRMLSMHGTHLAQLNCRFDCLASANTARRPCHRRQQSIKLWFSLLCGRFVAIWSNSSNTKPQSHLIQSHKIYLFNGTAARHCRLLIEKGNEKKIKISSFHFRFAWKIAITNSINRKDNPFANTFCQKHRPHTHTHTERKPDLISYFDICGRTKRSLHVKTNKCNRTHRTTERTNNFPCVRACGCIFRIGEKKMAFRC